MHFPADRILCWCVAIFSACLQQLHFWQMFWQECRFSLRRVVLFIIKADFMLEWILWILLGLLYVLWEERQWLVLAVLGFYSELGKVGQLRNYRAGREFCMLWIMSMAMCCAPLGGRLLQFVLKLTELAPCNASIPARCASRNCSHLGRIWMSLFLSFLSSFCVPETEWCHTTLRKPLVLKTPPKHDPHKSPVRWIWLVPFYRDEPEAQRN